MRERSKLTTPHFGSPRLVPRTTRSSRSLLALGFYFLTIGAAGVALFAIVASRVDDPSVRLALWAAFGAAVTLAFGLTAMVAAAMLVLGDVLLRVLLSLSGRPELGELNEVAEINLRMARVERWNDIATKYQPLILLAVTTLGALGTLGLVIVGALALR